MQSPKWQAFQKKLEAHYAFPAPYRLTCIIKKQHQAQTLELMKGYPTTHLQSKPSKKGNYLSLTFTLRAKTADQVIAAYQALSQVEGIVFI